MVVVHSPTNHLGDPCAHKVLIAEFILLEGVELRVGVVEVHVEPVVVTAVHVTRTTALG